MHSIIQKHNGKIFVSSELGNGSKFTIYILAEFERQEVLIERDEKLNDSIILGKRFPIMEYGKDI